MHGKGLLELRGSEDLMARSAGHLHWVLHQVQIHSASSLHLRHANAVLLSAFSLEGSLRANQRVVFPVASSVGARGR